MKRLALALAVLTNTAFTPTLLAQDKTSDKAAKATSANTVKIFEGKLGRVATQLHITMDAKGKMKQAEEVPVSFIVKDDEGNATTFSFTSWNVFTLVEAPCGIGFPTCPPQPLEKTGDRVVVKYTVRGGKNVAKSVKKADSLHTPPPSRPSQGSDVAESVKKADPLHAEELPKREMRYKTGGKTAYDTKTKLTWQRGGSSTMYTWADAKTYCTGVGRSLGGAGWRLPTIEELRAIVDDTQANPSIDSTTFPSTPADRFWSSSPVANSPSDAWAVYFDSGQAYSFKVSLTGYVRCVR
jgi:hypothetical protein